MLGEVSNSLNARVSVLWGHRDVRVLGSKSFTGAVVLIKNGLELSGQKCLSVPSSLTRGVCSQSAPYCRE